MATIALQNGKVILKDGKASCTCCDSCTYKESDTHVFEITKEEYDSYIQGGNWVINYSYYIPDGPTGENNRTSFIVGGLNTTIFLAGKENSISEIGFGSWYGWNGFQDYYFNVGCRFAFSYKVCIIKGKYYINFIASGGTFGGIDNLWISYEPPPYFPDPNPPLPMNFVIDGNPLYSNYTWNGLDNGTGNLNLNMTFNAL
jgi:hypothetical protein